MSRFVSFNDYDSDPTYAVAEGSLLVFASESEEDWNENPCVSEGAVSTPLFPKTPADLEGFARFFGFSLERDNEGQLILYTGIVDPDD